MQSNMLFTVRKMDRITYDMDDFAVGRLVAYFDKQGAVDC